MKYKIFLIISLFCSILPFENIYGIENKILFKIDNEIITSLDLLDEINYIKTTNNKLKNIKDNKIYEISKNSLIREKIKEIENRKNLKDINIDQDYLNSFLVNYFKTLGISSVNELNEYFNNRDIDPEKVKKKIITEMLWNQMIYMKFSKKINIDRDLIKKDIGMAAAAIARTTLPDESKNHKTVRAGSKYNHGDQNKFRPIIAIQGEKLMDAMKAHPRPELPRRLTPTARPIMEKLSRLVLIRCRQVTDEQPRLRQTKDRTREYPPASLR